jgi:hypothetical protein
MMEEWIRGYFSEKQLTKVLDISSGYGTEEGHREEERGKRDGLIILRGSIDVLGQNISVIGRKYLCSKTYLGEKETRRERTKRICISHACLRLIRHRS